MSFSTNVPDVRLSEREAQVIRMRYGIGGFDPMMKRGAIFKTKKRDI